jgi:hypothetical protein
MRQHRTRREGLLRGGADRHPDRLSRAILFPQFVNKWNSLQGRGTPALHIEMADWLGTS